MTAAGNDFSCLRHVLCSCAVIVTPFETKQYAAHVHSHVNCHDAADVNINDGTLAIFSSPDFRKTNTIYHPRANDSL